MIAYEISEHDWFASHNPIEMIWCLPHRLCDCLSERKRRLFACVCCHAIRDFLDERDWNSVLAAEEYADGEITLSEFTATSYGSNPQWDRSAREVAFCALVSCTTTDKPTELDTTWVYAALALHMSETGEKIDDWPQVHSLERNAFHFGSSVATRCKVDFSPLLRCIFGNPFRPVAVDPQWLTSTVTQLAQGIYDDRAFDRLPILADALQDAGCDNADVLNHCRDNGPHARGCWVVDLVLGKA